MTEAAALVDLLKWALGIIVALVGVLWAIVLWEQRQLRQSLHQLRDKLPEIIVQWIDREMRKRNGH